MKAKPAIYSDAYYTRLFEIEERHWWNIGMREISQAVLRSELPPGRPRRVLDVGCGSGASLLWLEEFAAGGPVVGLDLSPAALRHSRARVGKRLTQASATALPISGASIDLVISVDVLQHLPRDGGDRRALREAFRVLAPGGLFFLRTNCAAPGRRNRAEFVAFHFYTEPELLELFAEAGFLGVRSTPVNVAADAAARVGAGLRHWLGGPKCPPMGPGLPELPPPRSAIRSMLLECLRLEAARIARGGRLPFGGSLVVTGRRPA